MVSSLLKKIEKNEEKKMKAIEKKELDFFKKKLERTENMERFN